MTERLAIVGGGNMGGALVGGLLAGGYSGPDDLVVVEIDTARADALRSHHPGVTVLPELDLPVVAAVLAVKPVQVHEAARAAVASGAQRLLSIAAGVATSKIEDAAGEGIAVVRAMPNTPALVGEGASAITAGRWAGEDDLTWAEEVLGTVGTVVRVAERDLDAVTGLSGSGPAYVFLVAEALIDAGVHVGLTRAVSEQLVRQLLVGSAALLAVGGRSPSDLRAEVTSPGGTTAAGVRELERAAVRAAFVDAVSAATVRSTELGRSTG